MKTQACPSGHAWKPDDKSRAACRGLPVFSMNAAAMRRHDLAGYGKTQPGMGAKCRTGGALRVKAVEYGFQRFRRYTRSVILDGHHIAVAIGTLSPPDRDPHGSIGRRKKSAHCRSDW